MPATDKLCLAILVGWESGNEWSIGHGKQVWDGLGVYEKGFGTRGTWGVGAKGWGHVHLGFR